MVKDAGQHLSRRERQIMDLIYARGQASAAEVQGDLHEELSSSAVRTFLRILEEKGHLRHSRDGARYIYRPTRPRQQAGRSALKRVLETFYDNSLTSAVEALLDVADTRLPPEEYERLARLIDEARKHKGDQA